MLDSAIQSFWSQPLLPNEARVLNPSTQRALTEKFLLPKIMELEIYLLEVRTQLDAKLEIIQPNKLGKYYPLGQCLEIAEAVQKRLLEIAVSDIPSNAIAGFTAMSKFLREGGIFRQVWGDLRGQYFQNAFQLGTLYIDVANDTVVATKPKVEILQFADAQFIPISDFNHFTEIANRYWEVETYSNHVLPALAPYCPLIHVNKQGGIQFHNATDYMLAMTRRKAFRPSEDVLSSPPMPKALFEEVTRLLEGSPHRLANSPEHGRRAALYYCQLYRSERRHLNIKLENQIKDTTWEINNHIFNKQCVSGSNFKPKEKTMSTIKIDDIEYDLDSLSAEANEQLQNLQFVDQELARLQAKSAVLQTARVTYANALKAALPEVKKPKN